MKEIKKYQNAINELQSYAENSWGGLSDVFDLAIKALNKQIPKKPIIEKWSPARCPSCDESLSESAGDGYYNHFYHLEFCKCGQKLEWK